MYLNVDNNNEAGIFGLKISSEVQDTSVVMTNKKKSHLGSISSKNINKYINQT